MRLFKKILIANRGEIAVRIIRAAREMNIRTAAVYSSKDTGDSLHASLADEALLLEGHTLAETYLNIERIIDVAKRINAEAIHPGYGFLAENYKFAKACEKSGILFIGPGADAIRLMGNKIESRESVRQMGLPVVEGFEGSTSQLLKKKNELLYPVLIKAAAGGGGKGMRIVKKADELKPLLEITSRESASYFNDSTVYLERYIDPARHIEIQVFADHHGNVIHLFERECTIQRRYQKIIEESPSPTLNSKKQKEMGEIAVEIVRKIGYTNAGTIEFLVDKDLNFYFLEMNTRIQVEHPVTELVTGKDLVQQQILVAAGNPLSWDQPDIRQNGHAVEARIYAENPEMDFRPSPGKIIYYSQPEMENIRIDSGQLSPTVIHPDYDPMIAKVVSWDRRRENAIEKLILALSRYHIHGISTNNDYLRAILIKPEFVKNKISTRFCEVHEKELIRQIQKTRKEIPVVNYIALFIAGAYFFPGEKTEEYFSPWLLTGYWRQFLNIIYFREGKEEQVIIRNLYPGRFLMEVKNQQFNVEILKSGCGEFHLQINGQSIEGIYSESDNGESYVSTSALVMKFKRTNHLPSEPVPGLIPGIIEQYSQFVVSPMPGKIIKIDVLLNDRVRKGDILFTVDSMKMENNIFAPRNGKVKDIIVSEGEQIEMNKPVIILE